MTKGLFDIAGRVVIIRGSDTALAAGKRISG